MRLPITLFGAAALAVAIVGCGGAPAGPTLAPGQTATPANSTPAPGATATPGGGTLTGHECDAIPTFDISNPNTASPAPDTTLNAHFPPTIDGQPVTEVESMQWLYLICAFGGQAALQAAAADSGGIPFATMSFGSAHATVDGEDVKLSAFRTPGTEANAIVQVLARLAAQSGELNAGNFAATSISGKNVFVATDTDGSKSYAYPSGDTVIFFDGVTDSQAAKIVAALP